MQVTEPEAAKARLNFDREQTLGQIADLEREFTAIVASAADGSAGSDDEHDPEGATVAFERQHVAALLDRARAHLDAIDAAARKLEAGNYEICDICGGPIAAERLAARPAALTCIRCAAGSGASRGGRGLRRRFRRRG
jgi:RNA polymerase-binding transcription factor DksA